MLVAYLHVFLTWWSFCDWWSPRCITWGRNTMLEIHSRIHPNRLQGRSRWTHRSHRNWIGRFTIRRTICSGTFHKYHYRQRNHLYTENVSEEHYNIEKTACSITNYFDHGVSGREQFISDCNIGSNGHVFRCIWPLTLYSQQGYSESIGSFAINPMNRNSNIDR